jgi:hypothetical protein
MAEKKDAPLDDLMMAMDVVDTLRHDEALVVKELGAEDRDNRMINRLRELYASQGIDVPDHILEAGVAGLKEDRFVYAPPAAGFMRFLAGLYVSRITWSKWLAAAVVAVVLAGMAWQFLVVAPRERAAEALQLELTEEIPAAVASLSERIRGLSNDKDVLSETDRLAGAARIAAEDGKTDEARKAIDDLRVLAAELAAAFEIHIVSRPGTVTGVTRIPEVNQNSQNYYIVVEAVAPDGSVIERKITSEEDGKVKSVTIWGQRVSRATFDAVRKDKVDDGIVQNSLLGTKERGKRAVDWTNGVEEGAITEW